LRLLNRLWGTGLTEEELAALAVGLGADVPFFLNGPIALATGIGEVLEPLPSIRPPIWLVLLQPMLDVPEKTARLYQALMPTDWSDGERTRAQAARLRAGLGLDPALLVNAFRRPLLTEYPAVMAAELALRAAGTTTVFPAGSGPTLVALCENEARAMALAAAVRGPERTVLVVWTLNGGV
jgi:4-diphosphocytidyl-2-C-methyl-D-erythritol kinase